MDRPDGKGREAILNVHVKGKPLEPDVNLTTIAKGTPGFAGADIENLVNEAAILAARRNKQTIGDAGVPGGGGAGDRRPGAQSRIITPKEKEIIAYHEAGHALVGHMLPNSDPPYKITIVTRGMAGGYTRYLPEEDRPCVRAASSRTMLAAALGGRCAEELSSAKQHRPLQRPEQATSSRGTWSRSTA